MILQWLRSIFNPPPPTPRQTPLVSLGADHDKRELERQQVAMIAKLKTNADKAQSVGVDMQRQGDDLKAVSSELRSIIARSDNWMGKH